MVYPLYWLVRAVFRLVFAGLYRWDVRGREHMPASGGVVVCANHISWWDPPLVASIFSRKVLFMAKKELFRYPVLGSLLPRVGAFPVRRHAADRRALRRGLGLLDAGEVVGIFPEGTRARAGKLREAEPGAALLAVRARVPVVPVAIVGPYRPFRPVRVRIGPPFELHEYYGRRLTGKDLLEAGRRIMERLGEAMEQDAPRIPVRGRADRRRRA